MLLTVALLETVALVGGTVHTLEADRAAAPGTLLIEGERIVAVGADVAVPDGARTIDATGMHLIPGLIDGFAYHDPDHDVLYVASGVTLVRDAGNSLMRILMERTPAARDRAPGPDLWVAGAVLDGAPPATTEAVVLASVAEAEDKLPRLFELGLDYVSCHNGLEPEVWKRSIELARDAGLASWGPRPRGASLRELCAAQPDGLFHLDGLLAAGQAWDKVTLAELEPALDAFAASGIAITPTLAIFGQRLIPPQGDPPELKLLGPLYVTGWMAELDLRKRLIEHDPETFLKAGLATVDVQGELLLALHRRGVRLVPGTGSPHPWLLPGRALIDELSLWRRAGLEQREILRLATAGAAETLGCADERGTLSAGKIADVVVLAADPTANLDALHRPELVVLRGRVLERAQLDALIAELQAVQAERHEQATEPIEVHEPELPEGQVLLTGKVETRAAGQRISAERFGVVREADGTFAYCGRMRTLGGASTEDSELGITQRVRDGKLASFTLRIRSGRSVLQFEGERGPGNLRVRRTLDGNLLDELKVPEQLLFVETGSVTSHLILGREAAPGTFRALFFDGTEPATGEWTLQLDSQNAHLCRTPIGDLIVRFDAVGFPESVVRRQGAAVVELRTLDAQTFGGPGLPLPAGKVPGAARDEPAPQRERRPLFGPAGKKPVEAGGGRTGDR